MFQHVPPRPRPIFFQASQQCEQFLRLLPCSLVTSRSFQQNGMCMHTFSLANPKSLQFVFKLYYLQFVYKSSSLYLLLNPKSLSNSFGTCCVLSLHIFVKAWFHPLTPHLELLDPSPAAPPNPFGKIQ